MVGPTYEFNEMENATISSTARFARMWGIISVVSGVLVLILGILMVVLLGAAVAADAATSGGSSGALKPSMVVALGFSLIPASLVSIIGGIFYFISGNSLKQVAETQGNDIPLLMNAVRSLSRAFMIEAIAMVVGFILGFIIGLLNQAGA